MSLFITGLGYSSKVFFSWSSNQIDTKKINKRKLPIELHKHTYGTPYTCELSEILHLGDGQRQKEKCGVWDILSKNEVKHLGASESHYKIVRRANTE